MQPAVIVESHPVFPAAREQRGETGWCDAVGQGDTQLAVKSIGSGLYALSRLLQCREDTRYMREE